MATDFRVVTPDDMGTSIRLGAKEPNKYDVDLSQLDLPASVTGVTLQGTVLAVQTSDGDKTVDLAPMLPKIATDAFLKNVQTQDNQIVFTVGVKGDTRQDNILTVNVADLAPATADGTTLTGSGTSGSPLKVAISATGKNLLKRKGDGLAVTEDEILRIIGENQPARPLREIRLVNASGQTVIGYIHSTE